MYFVVDQSRICERKYCQLYSCCEAARIGNVMSLSYFFPCAFAQAIDESASRIIPVKSEIVAEVDDPAFGFDVVGVCEFS